MDGKGKELIPGGGLQSELPEEGLLREFEEELHINLKPGENCEWKRCIPLRIKKEKSYLALFSVIKVDFELFQRTIKWFDDNPPREGEGEVREVEGLTLPEAGEQCRPIQVEIAYKIVKKTIASQAA